MLRRTNSQGESGWTFDRRLASITYLKCQHPNQLVIVRGLAGQAWPALSRNVRPLSENEIRNAAQRSIMLGLSVTLLSAKLTGVGHMSSLKGAVPKKWIPCRQRRLLLKNMWSIVMHLLKSLSQHLVMNIAVTVIVISVGHVVFYLLG